VKECTVDENLVLASLFQLGQEEGLRERVGLPSFFASEVVPVAERAYVLLASKAWVDRLAIEAEREACANLAVLVAAGEGRLAEFDGQPHAHGEVIAQEIAAKIRARGAK
jgi:hypothetical protein